MQTSCPQCGATYTLTADQIKQRQGMVRCGQCRHVFNALHYQTTASQAYAPRVSARSHHSVEPHLQAPTAQADKSFDERMAELAHEPSLGLYEQEPSPSFGADQERAYPVRHYKTSSGWAGLWFFLSVLALIALVVQALFVFRNQIVSQWPQTRGPMMQFCEILSCQVGEVRNVKNMTLSDVSIKTRPDKAAKDGFVYVILSAKLNNQGQATLPWPHLVLSFQNALGAVESSRIIAPKDYLITELQTRPMNPESDYTIRLPLKIEADQLHGFNLSLYFSDENQP
ncbi:DUF3426 domain-containing protein [Brackiella oedipodis]|uniref:DUF3426 domain-containing protein n=1 Tax=Brackiella oedipodis TaxID=124225 RepID=UPI00048C245D|nr:DUF3426 domain-containing protein [Brackiella oedipodis]